MENEEAKHLGALGTASRCAGAGIGTVAKVTAGIKNLLTRPIDEELDNDSDEQSKYTCEPKPETQDQDTEDNGLVPLPGWKLSLPGLRANQPK